MLIHPTTTVPCHTRSLSVSLINRRLTAMKRGIYVAVRFYFRVRWSGNAFYFRFTILPTFFPLPPTVSFPCQPNRFVSVSENRLVTFPLQPMNCIRAQSPPFHFRATHCSAPFPCQQMGRETKWDDSVISLETKPRSASATEKRHKQIRVASVACLKTVYETLDCRRIANATKRDT